MERVKKVWSRQEWRLVLLAALPALEKIQPMRGAGVKRAKALGAGQRVALPKARHYDDKALISAQQQDANHGHAFTRAKTELAAMSPEEREALAAQFHRPRPGGKAASQAAPPVDPA